ncbi:MAG: Acg family FMN-binding oxidoreductase, partial [Geminicoccaceae bacterium]
MKAYERAVAETRAALSAEPDLAEVVRYATLAATSHNTQPWRFRIFEGGVEILPDFERRMPIVDPDDHHLFISLGCAAENFELAAEARGRPAAMTFYDAAKTIAIDLAQGRAFESDLFRAIPERQCSRSVDDGRSVPVCALKQLEKAAGLAGVEVLLITARPRIEQLLDFVIAGNSRQIDNPEFVAELKRWIRFNPNAALVTGDGLFSLCMGNPIVPSFLGNLIFRLVLSKRAENRKYAEQLRSSAGVALFVGDKSDKASWVKVGRSSQRFALQATALGIRHAYINQPVEVAEIRPDFAQWLGLGDRRPDLVIRFGYGKA